LSPASQYCRENGDYTPSYICICTSTSTLIQTYKPHTCAHTHALHTTHIHTHIHAHTYMHTYYICIHYTQHTHYTHYVQAHKAKQKDLISEIKYLAEYQVSQRNYNLFQISVSMSGKLKHYLKPILLLLHTKNFTCFLLF